MIGSEHAREPEPAPPPGSVGPDEPLQHTLRGVIRALDAVFGATMVALAAFGTWLLIVGEARPLTVAALWSIPVFNVTWSTLTRASHRVAVELIRHAVCLPIVVFLYVAETGILERLWIVTFTMAVGASFAISVASRGNLIGSIVTLVYAGALLVATTLHLGSFDFRAVNHAVAIVMTGQVISLVASRLGRTLDDARHQRDEARAQSERAEAALRQLTQRSSELTTAIANLHGEMEHRMRVEVELRQVQKLESVGRLAAGVAHEINTPVQFVSDSIQFVRDGMAELFGVVDQLEVVHQSVVDGTQSRDAAIRAADAMQAVDLPYLVEHVPKALDRALDGLNRVAIIVRSMKDFAHPDTREMVAADLNRAIESTLTMARNEYRDVAELETHLGELPLVTCHVGQLNQAVLNIVINAAHAIRDVVEGTEAKGRIDVTTYLDGDEVVIAIADTGDGIPEHAQSRIFDPFFTTKAVGQGTGQGLAIARSVIVDKHRGTLRFETEPGKATTFYIRIPVEPRAPELATLASLHGPARRSRSSITSSPSRS